MGVVMRVLHLPTDIGGNAWGLSRGERRLGLESEMLVATSSKRGYPADINLNLDQYNSRYLRYLKQFYTFLKIRNQYDVFHFNWGSSLMHAAGTPWLNQFDLPFYPKKAKLFATYNGCDARQKYPTMQRTPIAACHNSKCYEGMCNSGELDKMRRRGVEKMSKYVKHIWALNPDLMYFLPEEKTTFLPYTVTNFDQIVIPPPLARKLKVVHAPTNQAAKGSIYILAAFEKLQKKYPDYFEPILVQNRPYAEALKIYQQADLIVDQILIGWYGAFTVETMLMGKPCIVRIAEEDLKFIPKQMAEDLLQAIINTSPENIYHTLERCLHDRVLLKRQGEACLEYALKWHNPLYVAGLTKAQYDS